MHIKETIKDWLTKLGKDREWLAEQCGVNKRTVDNWLSTSLTIPKKPLALIQRLMDENKVEWDTPGTNQNLVLNIDSETFDRWCQAAMKNHEIPSVYCIRVIEEAAATDLADPGLKSLPMAAEDPQPFKYPKARKHGAA